jgi:peptide/nickel transport system ATP-binding protein
VLAVVGESGSGKSVTGLSILGLIDEPGRSSAGHPLRRADLATAAAGRDARYRGADRDDLPGPDDDAEPGAADRHPDDRDHAGASRHGAREAWALCRDALGRVGIPSPDERHAAYPHQFSGGMRQRVAIAIALLNEPELIIADEPTTALDVTIQAQILHLMQTLVEERGMGLIWITHDLSVVAGSPTGWW